MRNKRLMSTRSIVAVATIGLAMAAVPAFAQGSRDSNTGTAHSDQTFVKKAAEGGMAEVELGKLAADKASSDQVKKFGQRMVEDHGKAADELKSIAQKEQIALPTDLNSKDKSLKNRLEKLSGESFDRAYVQAMTVDHTKDVKEFQAEANSGKDPEVKAWAAKTLPTLEDHLKSVRDLRQAEGTSGTKQ